MRPPLDRSVRVPAGRGIRPCLPRFVRALWPAFVMACALELLLFAAVDPAALLRDDVMAAWGRTGVYSIVFLAVWLALACAQVVMDIFAVGDAAER